MQRIRGRSQGHVCGFTCLTFARRWGSCKRRDGFFTTAVAPTAVAQERSCKRDIVPPEPPIRRKQEPSTTGSPNATACTPPIVGSESTVREFIIGLGHCNLLKPSLPCTR